MTTPDVICVDASTALPEQKPVGHCSPKLNSTGAATSLK